MRLRCLLILGVFAVLGNADTLTLRSGRVVHGEYIGGDARHIKFTLGDRVETYSVDDVDSLQFGGGGQAQQEAPPQAPPPAAAFAQQPAQPAPSYGMQIPVGTKITIRMIDSVNSEQTRLGETFRASVDEPVLVNEQTVVPRGADAFVKLVEDKQSGKFEGKTVLTLVLQQVMVNGRMLDITTGDVSEASKIGRAHV